MLHSLKQAWYRRQLQAPEYARLFDDPPADEWVSVDCETTGLDRKRDEILSIGAVRIRGRRILTSEALHILVRPSGAVPAASIRVHQLRAQDVRDGLTPQEAIERFLDFAGASPLVGYNLAFDVAMLNRLVQPLTGIPLPQQQIDVATIYRQQRARVLEVDDIDLRFESIMRELKLPMRHAHDALNDAIMTAMIFLKLRQRARAGR